MASSQPPPRACPDTAAMTGVRRVIRCDHGAMKFLVYASAKVSGAISLMSAPAANALSLPVITMAPMLGSSS